MVQTSSMQGRNSSKILGLYCVFAIFNLEFMKSMGLV